MGGQIDKQQDDNACLSYWLSNTVTLLYLLQRNIKPASGGSYNSRLRSSPTQRYKGALTLLSYARRVCKRRECHEVRTMHCVTLSRSTCIPDVSECGNDSPDGNCSVSARDLSTWQHSSAAHTMLSAQTWRHVQQDVYCHHCAIRPAASAASSGEALPAASCHECAAGCYVCRCTGVMLREVCSVTDEVYCAPCIRTWSATLQLAVFAAALE